MVVVAPARRLLRGDSTRYRITGDGLGSDDSRALADVLQREINSGRCEAYAKIREAELATLPNRLCDYCAGAGELTTQHIKLIEERRATFQIGSVDDFLG